MNQVRLIIGLYWGQSPCLLPWLKDSIQLALFGGGRRREEIACLKWSNILPHPSGSLFGGTVNYRNLKVERARGILFRDEQLHIEVPITKQLAELLTLMGWKKLQGSDSYIIAPEIENRTKIMEDMSRGFGHYYQQIKNPRDKISFKSIRKTYITYIRALISGDAKSITGHTKDRTIEKHYEDTTLIREKVSKGLKF